MWKVVWHVWIRMNMNNTLTWRFLTRICDLLPVSLHGDRVTQPNCSAGWERVHLENLKPVQLFHVDFRMTMISFYETSRFEDTSGTGLNGSWTRSISQPATFVSARSTFFWALTHGLCLSEFWAWPPRTKSSTSWSYFSLHWLPD